MSREPIALHKLFQLIALDNGGINRSRTVEQQKAEANDFLTLHREDNDYDAYENWLSDKTEEQLLIIASGEESEIEGLLADAPEGLDDFLNDYFDEVC